MQEFLKLTGKKGAFTFVVASFLIFFGVPFVYQTCQPKNPNSFGGGGCIGVPIQNISYAYAPLPSGVPLMGTEEFTLSQILSQRISRPLNDSEGGYIKNTSFYYGSIFLVLFFILFSYLFSCTSIFVAYSIKKQKKINGAKTKK